EAGDADRVPADLPDLHHRADDERAARVAGPGAARHPAVHPDDLRRPDGSERAGVRVRAARGRHSRADVDGPREHGEGALTMAGIELVSLKKNYGKVQVVKGLDVTIGSGELVSL